jgi:cytochrome c oxidase subunit I+III
VMVAAVPFDTQVTDTYFVVGHIHYVLLGGAVAPLLGAFYHWYPKFTGRMLSERIGRWNFWTYFVGVNLAFAPMVVLGLAGMTRRVYTYAPETGWGGLNLVSSIGAAITAISIALFVLNVALATRRRADAPSNPWDAGTLEWATPSPPPSYNFVLVPYVTSRTPLWERNGELPYVTGLHIDEKEILVTAGMDAVPDLREPSPDTTIWPFLAALATGVTLLASIFTPWALVWGALPIGVGLVGWLWPRGPSTAFPPPEAP